MSKQARKRLSLVPASVLVLLLGLLLAGGSPSRGQSVAACGNGVIDAGESCDPGGRCAPSDGSLCTADSDCPGGSSCVPFAGDGDCCSDTCQVEESAACETCSDGDDNDGDGLADGFDPECATLAELYDKALIISDDVSSSWSADFGSETRVLAVDGSERDFLAPLPPYPPFPPYPVGASAAESCLPNASFEPGARFDGPVTVDGRSIFLANRLTRVGPTLFGGLEAGPSFPGLPGLVSLVPPGKETRRGLHVPLLGRGACSLSGAPCLGNGDCLAGTCVGKVELTDPAAEALGLVDRSGTAEAFLDCQAAYDELTRLPNLLREFPPTQEPFGRLRSTQRSGDQVITLADDADEVVLIDSLRIGPSSNLVLRGNPRSVILRVADRIQFSRHSNMVLEGGLTADRVLWLLDGRARLRLAPEDENDTTPLTAYGTFFALERPLPATLGSNSVLEGALFSTKVRMQQGSTVAHIPFSPMLPIDLRLEKEAAPNPPNPAFAPDVTTVAAGEDLRYTLRVTNRGMSQAPATTVTDTLPAEVAFVAASATQGGCLHDGSEFGAVVTCYLGTLDRVDRSPDNQATITLDVRVRDNIDATIQNTATVEAGPGELDPADNEASFDTPVVTLCNILGSPAAPPTFALVTDSGVSATDGITNVADVSVDFAKCGTWEYQVDNGGWLPGTGNGFQLQSGRHTYVVRHTDVENTTSPASPPQEFDYDAAAQAPTLTLLDANDQPITGIDTNDPGAYLAIGGLEDGAQWSYLIDLDADWIPGVGDRLELEEGTHGYIVRQVDLAGNERSTGGTFLLDTGVVAELVATLAEDTGAPGDGITANPLVLVDNVDPDALWEYRVDTQPVWTAGEVDSFDLLPGAHLYTLRQTDSGGNRTTTAPVEFEYSKGVATPILRLATDSGPGENGILVDGISNQARVLVYNLEPNATWEYRVDTGAWTPGSGDGFDMLQDGQTHSYWARQTNEAAVESLESDEVQLRYDATPPAPVSLTLVTDSGTLGDGITNVPEIQVVGLEEGDLFEYRVDAGDWILWRAAVLPMKVGEHTYSARRYDVAGNVSSVTDATFTYLNADIGAPRAALEIDSGFNPGDGVTNDGRINILRSGADANATWEYQVDDGEWQTGTGNSFTALPGEHSYRVRQRDAAGNESPASDPFSFNLSSGAPQFTSAASAAVADPDSDGPAVVGSDVLLYTAVATDPDGIGVRYSVPNDSPFTIDGLTGDLHFKDPVGYALAGPNLYTAEIEALGSAGNSTTLNVEIEVGRTNTSAPQIDLGEVKTGVLTFDNGYSPLIVYPPGGYLGVRSGNVYRLDEQGIEDPNFTPIPVGSNLGRFYLLADAQGRIYTYLALGNVTPPPTLKRYRADGTLDTGYGAGGTVVLPASPSSEVILPADAGIRDDGTFFTVGTHYNATVNFSLYSTLRVVDPNGNIITNVSEDFTPGSESQVSITAGSSSQDFYVANAIIPSGGAVFYRLFRYTNGSRNSGFGSGGMIDFGETAPKAIWVDPQGRLLILRSGTLTRYSAAGVADGSFSAPIVPFAQYVHATFRSDGGMFLYGSSSNDSWVRSFTPNGGLNTSFGAAGVQALGPRSATNVNQFLSTSRTRFVLNAVGTSLVLATTTSSFSGGVQTTTARATHFDTAGELDTGFGDVALTITEGNRPIAMLTTAASVIDLDQAATNYDGVSVTIERQGGANPDDVFGARGLLQLNDLGEVVWDGVVVGEYNNAAGRLEIVFNELAPHDVFDGVLRALTYYSNTQQPDARVRLVWTINDNDPVGARSATAIQTINIVDDSKDVGDPRLNVNLGGAATSLGEYLLIDGKHYYVLRDDFGVDHDTLDQRFNGGADTTDSARTVTSPEGHTFKLLTQTELQTFWANPVLPSSHAPAAFNNQVWSATLGSGPGNHIAYQYTIFQSLGDYEYAPAIIEAIPSPFAASGPVEPQFELAEDNGDLDDDNLTSNGRLNILGFEQALAHEFSLDGGDNWSARPAGSELFFVLPVGIHPAGTVMARQTDASGFETVIVNTVAYNVDNTIRSMRLLNDQGVLSGDNISADGRVAILNFDPLLPWEYSIDGGQNWQTGGPLGDGLGFVLANGAYPAGTLRVRQEVAGFMTGTSNQVTYAIDPVNGQGMVDLATDTGDSAVDGLTSDPRVTVTGLNANLAWEYSTNGGSNWQAGTQTVGAIQSITLAEGSYAAGAVVVRQEDATGFVTQLASTGASVIDRSIGQASIALLNDTGISNTDLTSADGTMRISLSNMDSADRWEYTVDGGKNWTAGVGSTSADVVLGNGLYAAYQVMVRVIDAAGNQSVAKFDKAFRIDNSDNTPPAFTSPPRSAVIDLDETGAFVVSTFRTIYFPAVTDANFVRFSLTGDDAGLFGIDPITGRVTLKQDTNYRSDGANTFLLAIVATDLFGNSSAYPVTVEIVIPPKLVSTTPANGDSIPTTGAIHLNFNVPVRLGKGAISLRNRDTAEILAFDVQDATQVSAAGNVVTIQPTTPLPDGAFFGLIASYGSVESLDGFRWSGHQAYWNPSFKVSNAVQLQSAAVVGLEGELRATLAEADEDQYDSRSSIITKAGDVNNDGRADFLVSLPKGDPAGRADAGKVYVVFGTDAAGPIDLGQVAAGTGGFVINGVAAGDEAGTKVAGLGDFDGDGFGDIAVTAPSAALRVGRAWVVYGKANGTPVELSQVGAGIGGFQISAADAVYNFDQVAGIGDFNGDGKADVAFASTQEQATVVKVETRDEVRTWEEVRTWTTTHIETRRETQPANVLSTAVSVGSFVNDPLEYAVENGFSFFSSPKEHAKEATGAQEVDVDYEITTNWKETTYYSQTTTYTTTTTTTSPAAGKVYVLFGGRSAASYQGLTLEKLTRASSTLGFSITGGKASGYLGYAMTALGDVNSDGFGDFYLGQRPWMKEINTNFIVHGRAAKPDNLKTSDLVEHTGVATRLFDTGQVGLGSTAVNLGDVNGDGRADLALGSWDGNIRVVHVHPTNALELVGGNHGYVIESDGDDEPAKIAAVGDVNGDSIPDLLAASNRGDKAWVIYGQTGTATVKLSDIEAGIGGYLLEASSSTNLDAVAGPGDFDNDGLSDLLFLMTDYDASFTGFLWLVPGNTDGPQF